MKRATQIKPKGSWRPKEAKDRIVLAFDQRWRRRLMLTTANGVPFLLDLPHAQVLRHGDALMIDGGGLIAVEAAGEELLDVRGSPQISLARLAWHLGNRHTPTAIEDDRILVRKDHVLADMLRRLGAEVSDVVAPFDPEGGAYATGHAAHGRGHEH
jgi:urease accessory protein